MKAASVKEIRKDLNQLSSKELMDICLKLSKFKKENKELLTYLLYEADNEEHYIQKVNKEVSVQFKEINTRSYYLIKKSVRKILRLCKKYIRYSKKKPTQVEILLHFCSELVKFRPSIKRNVQLVNLYDRQIASIKKTIATLHEDLQYDYAIELEELQKN